MGPSTHDSAVDAVAADMAAVEIARPAEGVALLRIVSRPLGVLRLSVKRALLAHLRDLEADTSIHALVLTGSGKSFSVGSDITEFKQEPTWLLQAEREEIHVNETIETVRFPVIAAVNGHALGGGLVLALACDLRVAARDASLGLPEVKVGAFASGSGTQRLARLIGRGRALHLLLTGRTISAEEALSIGLVEEVAEDAEARAVALAGEIASLPRQAVEASKRATNVGLRYGFDAGLVHETELAVRLGLTADAAEGQRAFVEKRSPSFLHR